MGDEIIRDDAWILREYGREKWPSVRRNLESRIDAGETSLARAVAALTRADWGAPGLSPVPAIADGRPVVLPGAWAWQGGYAMIADAVIAACTADTGAVYDLGAGWGRSLFQVWLQGGPPAALYGALEFTESGRDCARRLAALEPALRFVAAPFDFRAPVFPGATASAPRHAVLFSVSSFHQITTISAPMIEALCGAADRIDCLMFEQVGFQVPGRDDPTAAAYATRNKYNTNLWPVLAELAARKKLEIVATHFDLFGTEPAYPLSLVWWRAGT